MRASLPPGFMPCECPVPPLTCSASTQRPAKPLLTILVVIILKLRPCSCPSLHLPSPTHTTHTSLN